MMNRSATRRGFGLIVLLVAMTVVGGLLTILSMRAANTYHLHRIARVRSVAAGLADSAAAYARRHQTEWAGHWPVQSLALDVQGLLPPGFTGSAVLSFETTAGRHICRVNSQTDMNGCEASDEIHLPMGPG